jgi:hypothetical protein
VRKIEQQHDVQQNNNDVEMEKFKNEKRHVIRSHQVGRIEQMGKHVVHHAK